MKPDGLRILGWIIPILCMAIAGWILFKENGDFATADAARNEAHREGEKASQELKETQDAPTASRFAAADDLPEEEPAFLNYLRTRTAANSVNFKNWSSQSLEYGKDKQVQSKDAKTAALLKGLRKVTGSLTFTGKYENIRKLVGEMESSERLYTLANINWSNVKGSTQLSMTISRYVAPAKPVPIKRPPPAKPAVAPIKKPGITSIPGITSTPGITTKP